MDTPFIVFWELTRACMLACKHCRAKAIRKRHPDELTTEECFNVIDQLSEFNPKPLLIITGGDPLMRDDVTEIISHAAEKGFRVAIAFSGTEKATEEKLRELKEAGVARVAVSIDGSDEEKHDSFRGVRGTFRMSMMAIENAKKAGLPFQINTTVTRENIEDLPNIARLCLELGAVMWDVFFVVPTGRAKAEMMPTPQQFEDVLCWLYDLSKKTGLNVKSSAATHLRRIELMRDRGEMPAVGELYYRLLERIEDFPEGEGIVVAGGHGKSLSTDGIRRAIGITDGRGMFFISHIGEVYPSGFLPIVAGNVRNTSLKEIYYSSEIFVNLRDPDRLKGKCGRCEYRKICGGSRARAYAVHGDYLAEEPCCIYIPQSSR
ncbi:TIGR04053 family radical SAM/SPASM domain-containing protein [Archaeoglobus fulgidus]|uniref:Coenzyme PQQ synthesis protein (PqqE) n=3 Tax=Archaeoglobus fulgidus TaxID=2234 RepID=O30258_ARCFU|nr:TIGR04053 family radical SAM/SPASM domain-containing protein [Archaeoglobus fulgidus]AAB91253.1 coenzyme PQQ synthesis protein (pqqE) [Archaeoglobus fulgidus DSM 4304]KUJ94780.1 MAG: Coenzyme PQQ synthesis protein (PqqE) [Archaeoglobus fulgidus]KUK07219.1 MAG: Coenzyme PQQ synthesis protein (PqqE) [Archaeoglobus fulgidus]